MLSFDGTDPSEPRKLKFDGSDNGSLEGTLKAGETATY